MVSKFLLSNPGRRDPGSHRPLLADRRQCGHCAAHALIPEAGESLVPNTLNRCGVGWSRKGRSGFITPSLWLFQLGGWLVLPHCSLHLRGALTSVPPSALPFSRTFITSLTCLGSAAVATFSEQRLLTSLEISGAVSRMRLDFSRWLSWSLLPMKFLGVVHPVGSLIPGAASVQPFTKWRPAKQWPTKKPRLQVVLQTRG